MDPNVDVGQLLATAREAAAAAAEVVTYYYGRRLTVSLKKDRTPVTAADLEAERTIRNVISERYPEHGWYGEESGQSRMQADVIWLVDPIDGTKSFVRGYPFFSIQIAVMKSRQLIVGVSAAPVFGETAWAIAGQGAWLNEQPIKVSDVDRLTRATVSTGNIGSMAVSSRWAKLGKILASADRTRGYGDFYHYHLLASGCLDVVIESDINILDIAALSVIVEAAGGCVSDLDGGSIALDSRSILATNSLLHENVRELLNA